MCSSSVLLDYRELTLEGSGYYRLLDSGLVRK